MSSLKYWVWLSSACGVGAITAGRLLRRFETPEKIFFARDDEYRSIEGIKPGEISGLSRKNIGDANKILAKCEENNFRVITINDAEYPDRLRNIYDPPITLYIRGKLPVIDEEAAVAIVGTRSCTPYGVKWAEDIAYRVARQGVLVVSGLARGIDSIAARGALRGGGRVLGVIGSGLDVIYPPENGELFDDVAARGAIISEYAPGTPAVGSNFPRRNRILSGVSLGVAVIEAPKYSGALITASRAFDEGRDVFTLPGNIDAVNSAGTNGLLKDHATPLLSADDILREYSELFPDKIRLVSASKISPLDKKNSERLVKKYVNDNDSNKEPENKAQIIDIDKILSKLTGDELAVATVIGGGTVQVDDIIVKTGFPAQKVLTALTMLEISGHALQSSGGFFSLTCDDAK